MAKKMTGAMRTMLSIEQCKSSFINMTSENRIMYLKSYKYLSSHQRIAIEQCKKYMTQDEKRYYRKALNDSKSSKAETGTNEPQPM